MVTFGRPGAFVISFEFIQPSPPLVSNIHSIVSALLRRSASRRLGHSTSCTLADSNVSYCSTPQQFQRHMTATSTVERQIGGPLYVRLADELASQMAAGALRPGDRLPGVRGLASQRRVSLATV